MDNDNDGLHKVVINIYQEFQKICDKYHLQYFAISGTTLGAVLWSDIIPWDDDMDIAMPAKDYQKFVNICKKSLPSHLAFSEYIWFGGKLHDKRTTFTNINYIHDPKRYNGVFIDIVPLIALPNDPAERSNFVESLKTFQKFGLLFDRYKDNEYGIKKLEQWRNTLMTSYHFGDTDYVMDFSDPRYVLSAKGFLNPTIMKFRNTTIPVSSNYKEDLKIQYGNYKKYPDKKTRNSIHNQQSILELHTPYSQIAKEFSHLPAWTQQMFAKKNDNEGSYLKSLFYTQSILETKEKELNNTTAKLTQTESKLNEIQKYYKEHPIKAVFSRFWKHQ